MGKSWITWMAHRSYTSMRVFYFSIPKNQYICFNYRNLRPLWAKDNLDRRFQKPIFFDKMCILD